MSAFPGLTLVAAAAVGCGFGDLFHFKDHHRQPVATRESCCDTCGVAPDEVYARIETLQTHPRWRTRDNAAYALRKFDWTFHPEILDALTTAMLSDCHEEVREEAAESLARISPPPCLGETHAALKYASTCDPDHATRKWARKALARLDDDCRDDCSVCEPAFLGSGAIVSGEPTLVLPPPTTYGESTYQYDLPTLPPLENPYPSTTDPIFTPPLPDPIMPPGPEILPPPPPEAMPFDSIYPSSTRPSLDDRLAARDRDSQVRPSRIDQLDDADDADDATSSRSARRTSPPTPRRGLFGLFRRSR